MSDDQSRPIEEPETGPTSQPSPAPSPGFQPSWQHPTYMPPPMPYPPVPAQGGSFKRGFGLGTGLGLGLAIGGIVLTIVGSLMTMLVLSGLIAAASPASIATATQRVETVWGAHTAAASDTVRAISISGPILAEPGGGGLLSSGTAGYEVASLLDSLTKEDSKGVILLVNTPGGTINGSRAISDAITRYQKRTGQKVVAFVRGMSASGGVYSMSASDAIIADHGSLVGSIGVVFGPFAHYKDVVATGSTILEPGVETKGGIEYTYLTQGKGKDFGNPYRDMTAEEKAVIEGGLKKEYNAFVNLVSEKRKIPAATIVNELGAYIFDAETAKEKGLIDDVMGPDEAFRHAADLMGIDPAKMRITRPKPPTAWESLLGADARVYGTVPAVASGQKVTNAVCVGSAQPLVFHGPMTSVCG